MFILEKQVQKTVPKQQSQKPKEAPTIKPTIKPTKSNQEFHESAKVSQDLQPASAADTAIQSIQSPRPSKSSKSKPRVDIMKEFKNRGSVRERLNLVVVGSFWLNIGNNFATSTTFIII